MDLLSVFLATQTRLINIPLLLLFNFAGYLLSATANSLTATEISMSTLILSYFSFFAFGGTNAISSVDLSNAYNGVSGYNIGAVGFLTFASNWIGPIYWSSTGIVLLARKQAVDHAVFLRHFLVLSTFCCVAVGGVMAACTALRTHLFIWTVFSPKFLYSAAWATAWHLGVNIGVGSVLSWASRKSLR